MKRSYAETPYGQIHYAVEGDGPVLLLLHSSSNSWRWYEELIPLLSEEHRVVAPDTLGFGNSDPLPPDASMPLLAESMAALLDDLGVRSSHVFGLHTGNKIGVAMAATLPDRVDRFVLCGQPHSIIPDEAERDAVIRAYGTVRESIHEFEPTADGSHLLKEWGSLHALVTRYWWDADRLAGNELSEGTIDRLATKAANTIQARDSVAAIYEANFAYDWSGGLPRVEAPTLVLELAEAGEVERHGYQGERVASILPDGTWVALDGVDDGVFYDSPETVASHVLAFLDD